MNWKKYAEDKLEEMKNDIIEYVNNGIEFSKAVKMVKAESTINDKLFDQMVSEIK